MKIGVLSYPMLFQNDGGLQVQICESIVQLRLLGFEVHLIDVTKDKLIDYDIVHVFAVTQGNFKLVEQARAKGCIVVVSSLLNRALVPQSTIGLEIIKFLGKVISRVSRYRVTTSYETDRKTLAGAHHVIALSEWERSTLNSMYSIPLDKITHIPNAVSEQFYDADPIAFLENYSIEKPFVFCPAQISPWKNQMTLINALVGTEITVVLAGSVAENEKKYLAACLAVPGAKVKYIGKLDRNSSVFAGCFAAADIVVLPSRSESGPLVALEALAAGTPAIVTKNNGLDILPDNICFSIVDPFDTKALRESVLRVLSLLPKAAQCKQLVSNCSWKQVANQIKDVYQEQIHLRAQSHAETDASRDIKLSHQVFLNEPSENFMKR